MASASRVGDAAIININGTILPSEVSKELRGIAMQYSPSSDEGWYYKLTNVTTSSGLLLSENSFVSKGGTARGIDIGSVSDSVSLSDKVKFLIVIHTGWIQTGLTKTEDSIFLSVNGTTAAHNGVGCFEVGYKEAWFGKMNNTTVADINAISGLVGGTGTSSVKIQCVVAAILEDV
jgi:hypothetical protein